MFLAGCCAVLTRNLRQMGSGSPNSPEKVPSKPFHAFGFPTQERNGKSAELRAVPTGCQRDQGKANKPLELAKSWTSLCTNIPSQAAGTVSGYGRVVWEGYPCQLVYHTQMGVLCHPLPPNCTKTNALHSMATCEGTSISIYGVSRNRAPSSDGKENPLPEKTGPDLKAGSAPKKWVAFSFQPTQKVPSLKKAPAKCVSKAGVDQAHQKTLALEPLENELPKPPVGPCCSPILLWDRGFHLESAAPPKLGAANSVLRIGHPVPPSATQCQSKSWQGEPVESTERPTVEDLRPGRPLGETADFRRPSPIPPSLEAIFVFFLGGTAFWNHGTLRYTFRKPIQV